VSSILVVGSLAFDSIETPFGKRDKIIGGSVNHFSLSASHYAKVLCVAIVGEDFPKSHLDLLQSRNIDTQGIQIAKGKTFFWAGRYTFDLNQAETLETQLNVFGDFHPQLLPDYRKAEYVFLGNISPEIQNSVLDQVQRPKVIAMDSMNYWIQNSKKSLVSVMERCHAIIINEAEARQLSEQTNLLSALKWIHALGPSIVIVKRGEYGALLSDQGKVFWVPGLPLPLVKDPTGAGDSFAGGVMGYLAQTEGSLDDHMLWRRAIVYGSTMASFTVEEFGSEKLLKINRDSISKRYQEFQELTRFS